MPLWAIFSPGECFILESRVNDVTLGESEEDRDLSMFLGASPGPGVQIARDAILAQLKTLDDTLEGLKIRGSVDKWVHVHNDRVQFFSISICGQRQTTSAPGWQESRSLYAQQISYGSVFSVYRPGRSIYR